MRWTRRLSSALRAAEGSRNVLVVAGSSHYLRNMTARVRNMNVGGRNLNPRHWKIDPRLPDMRALVQDIGTAA
jgi:hypothetical protein